MMKEKSYECENCGKTVKSLKGKIPECCGKSMKKIPLGICTQPAHAEHSRPMEDEDACDDFNAGE